MKLPMNSRDTLETASNDIDEANEVRYRRLYRRRDEFVFELHLCSSDSCKRERELTFLPEHSNESKKRIAVLISRLTFK